MIKHSPECIASTIAIASAQEAWLRRWPNYCRKCNAWGGYHDPGVYRYADGSGEPPHYDECECVEEGRCPRCGMDWNIWSLATLLVEEGYPCPCCGWNWGLGRDDTLYDGDGECGCEYDETLNPDLVWPQDDGPCITDEEVK